PDFGLVSLSNDRGGGYSFVSESEAERQQVGSDFISSRRKNVAARSPAGRFHYRPAAFPDYGGSGFLFPDRVERPGRRLYRGGFVSGGPGAGRRHSREFSDRRGGQPGGAKTSYPG